MRAESEQEQSSFVQTDKQRAESRYEDLWSWGQAADWAHDSQQVH